MSICHSSCCSQTTIQCLVVIVTFSEVQMPAGWHWVIFAGVRPVMWGHASRGHSANKHSALPCPSTPEGIASFFTSTTIMLAVAVTSRVKLLFWGKSFQWCDEWLYIELQVLPCRWLQSCVFPHKNELLSDSSKVSEWLQGLRDNCDYYPQENRPAVGQGAYWVM